jgi:hypothetical protein
VIEETTQVKRLEPGDERTCEDCGAPAVWLVIAPGCRFCGGADCGDSGDIYALCDKHNEEP